MSQKWVLFNGKSVIWFRKSGNFNVQKCPVKVSLMALYWGIWVKSVYFEYIYRLKVLFNKEKSGNKGVLLM